MYKSPTDTWVWKLGLRPRNSFSENNYFEFSVPCLCIGWEANGSEHKTVLAAARRKSPGYVVLAAHIGGYRYQAVPGSGSRRSRVPSLFPVVVIIVAVLREGGRAALCLLSPSLMFIGQEVVHQVLSWQVLGKNHVHVRPTAIWVKAILSPWTG